MHRIKITPLIRFLLVLCIIVAGTAVKPQVVKAAAKPGWIVSCTYSHSLKDDPIVFPVQVGASHLHDFTGAKTTNAFSTFTSLRAGGTTCAMPGDKSAYWVPALYEDGVRILPQAPSGNSVFYYRRIGAPEGTVVQPFPTGLKILIGNARAMSPQENPGLGTDIVFNCGPGEQGTPPLPAPPTQCDSGIMVLSLTFPNCWDGVNLDSADHRSHMSYPVSSRCPASHPVNLPRLESFFRYIVGAGPIGTITLDSGPYYTAHQDFFNGWHPAALQTLVTNCINAGIDCGRNPSLPPGILSSTISGNAGMGGVSLSYTDVTAKTVTSSGNGTYALPVSDNWSGSITPSHACFNFTPTSLNYSNVITNQTGQNYVPTLKPAANCTDVDVLMGGSHVGNYGVPPEKSIFDRYKINNGPVKVSSTNALPILTSQRAIFGSSFNSIVGYPANQLTTDYWFTSYDDTGMTTFLVIGNPHATLTAQVDVYIGGIKRNATPYSIAPGQRIFPRYTINAGPVHVVSTNGVDIFTSERTKFGQSFNEVMGYPGNQLTTAYWFTSYDDTGMITYLVIGNPHATLTAEVDVYIAGNKMNTTPYSIAPGQRIFPRYGINAGPVYVVSTNGVDIITSERSKFGDTFNEVMGYPADQLTTDYWFTSYDDVGMTTYLVIGNPHPSNTAEVDVYINGVKKNATPYSIAPGQRIFPRYAINGGPVHVVSTNGVNIFASERAKYLSSFNEILGLANNQLTTDYWFTSYDDLGMTTYLVIGTP